VTCVIQQKFSSNLIEAKEFWSQVYLGSSSLSLRKGKIKMILVNKRWEKFAHNGNRNQSSTFLAFLIKSVKDVFIPIV